MGGFALIGTVVAVRRGFDCNYFRTGSLLPYARNRPCSPGRGLELEVVQRLGVTYVPGAFELRELWKIELCDGLRCHVMISSVAGV